MNIARFGFVLVASTLFAATGAFAADDSNGATQILQGDYVGAERIILAQEKMFPGDPDLLLNLASVYRHTGRVTQARALYRSVLARPDDVMDMPDAAAPRTAHDLARTALATLDATQLTAR